MPAARLARWIDGFRERHGGSEAVISGGALHLLGADGATALISPLFQDSGNTVDDFLAHVAHPPRCAAVLVRRGGMAAAIVSDGALEASKVGKRYVQGRTAAGGWSQQRFARRRDKQVNELVDAAVGYVAEIVLPRLPVEYVVTGGDRPLVEQLLADPRLRALPAMPRGPHLAIPDPTRDVLASLPTLLTEVRIDVTDA